MELFDPVRLRAFARENCTDDVAGARLGLLRQLCNRHSGGWLSHETESKVEQSFNERLFADVFDYKTLFRDGLSEFQLRPKNYYPSGRYDDFGLGFYSLDKGVTRVSAELKGPRVQLESHQTSGSYAGLTPVQQAFQCVEAEGTIEWILVSNFDEVRIFHYTDTLKYEQVVLTRVSTREGFKRAYALLARPNLIGDSADVVSPLTKLYHGGPPKMLKEKREYVRLVQEARPTHGDSQKCFLSQLYGVLASEESQIVENSQMELTDDRIRLELFPGTDQQWLMEFTSDGLVRSWQYLSKRLNALELRTKVKGFISLGYSVLSRLGYDPLSFDFILYDLQDSETNDSYYHAVVPESRAWLDSVAVRNDGLDWTSNTLKELTGTVANELLFRFQSKSDGSVLYFSPDTFDLI